MRSLTTLLAALLMVLAAQAWAQPAADAVKVDDPYVRAVPPGQPNSASFMTLRNEGSGRHTLVGAESPVAKVVELHTHTEEGGMMRMRPVEKIELPAGESVALQPGGLHVMLIGLEQKLVPGEEIPVRLLFEDNSTLDIKAPVRKLRMQMKKMQPHQ